MNEWMSPNIRLIQSGWISFGRTPVAKCALNNLKGGGKRRYKISAFFAAFRSVHKSLSWNFARELRHILMEFAQQVIFIICGLSIENKIYIRVEFRESLGMNFVSPFQPERKFKVYKSCKCYKLNAVEYINTVCSLNYPFQFRIF